MKKSSSAFFLLCAVCFPLAAFADAGTPLIWASALHLVFGNAFVGVFEGTLLASFFGVRKRRAIGAMILANYFSAWVGGVFLNGCIVQALPLNLNNVRFFFWTMVVVTYLMTLVLEFPFVWLVFRGDPCRLGKAVRGSLLIQTVSYVVLFGVYWAASGTSLLSGTKIVQPSALALPAEVVLYFISSKDGNVYATGLAQLEPRQVAELRSTNRNDRLLVRVSATDSNSWDLIALLVAEKRQEPMLVTIQKNFATEAAPGWRALTLGTSDEADTWFNFGPVGRLGSAKRSAWEFRSGFWPVSGLSGAQTNTGARAGFSFETPFGAWIVRNATLLPGDNVLFQFGNDQICAFDPLGRRIALVTQGRGPVAVLHESTPVTAK